MPNADRRRRDRGPRFGGLLGVAFVLAATQAAGAGPLEKLIALQPEIAANRQLQAEALAGARQSGCIRADPSQKKTLKICSTEIEPFSKALKSNKDLNKKLADIRADAKANPPGKTFKGRMTATSRDLKTGREALAAALAPRLAVKALAAAAQGKTEEAGKACKTAGKLAETSQDAGAHEMVARCATRLAGR